MIKITGPKTPPAILNSIALKKFRNESEQFFKQRSPHSQEQVPWPNYSIVNKVLQALSKIYHHKCAYCETPLDITGMTFDHFRPAKFARGLNKEYSEKHYWWLAFRWQNILLSCQACNKAKSSWFPVKGSRAPVKSTMAHIKKENALLVDPTIDNPRLHLRFDNAGKVVANNERGATTIEILQLNRKDLIEKRIASTKDLEGDIQKLITLKASEYKFHLKLILIKLINIFGEQKNVEPYLGYKRSLFYDLTNQPKIYQVLFQPKGILITG
ncbi:MAG: hypothetical protein H0V30_11375, partial [Chitinophagaceae bacterium]|nr:hypothetical protein [Chitinophagaceae bacterium]